MRKTSKFIFVVVAIQIWACLPGLRESGSMLRTGSGLPQAGQAGLAWAASSKSQRPTVGLRVEPEYFSPNADEFQDSTFFQPLLKSEKEVTRWRLVVETERGKTIEKLHGIGFPALVKWDGQDKNQKPVAEGKYRAQLIVWGNGFKAESPWAELTVDNTAPFAALTVSATYFALTPSGENKLVFTPQVEDKSPLQSWEFKITDAAERVIHVEQSSATVTNIEWNGANDATGILAPKGVYRCSLSVLDRAGNKSLPAYVDVEIGVSAAELLQRVLNYIRPHLFVTEMGLVCQLPFEKIFKMKKGKPEMTPEAEDFLREAAILVNVYPDAPVAITGYARQFKTWEEDRALSSRLAWDVYSSLVKKGRVLGSRVKVAGKGRSPTFSRRQYDNPPNFLVLKNGVEIILQGNRDWSQ